MPDHSPPSDTPPLILLPPAAQERFAAHDRATAAYHAETAHPPKTD